MICPGCGRQNRPDAVFCDACGKSLASPSGSPSPPFSSAQDGFIGRTREISALISCLEDTRSGHGRLVVLSGEPGIGKTRTAQELARHAEQLGATVLWGRCHEEPGAPPYWPWVQTLRGWLDCHADDAVRAVVGGAAVVLSDIVPELSLRLPGLPAPSPPVDPAQGRFRLFDAISSFWKRAAVEQPLVLILDNVHWADVPSLRVLEFLAPEIDRSRLMVLATYRDVELTRRHPLLDSLGELARHRSFQRLRLTGLTLEETARFVGMFSQDPPPEQMVVALHSQTEGNPLFLAEICRFLKQEGLIGTAASPGGKETVAELKHIPEGVRAVIGTRLNRLSPACNRMLGDAAVIGRKFSLDVLLSLLDEMTEPQCAALLEEALAAGVISEADQPGSYEFSHALVRESLYEEMPPPRRSRLHERIGVVLEEFHGDDASPPLSLLAHHFCAALPGGDLRKAMEYARRAAERAEELLAYEEAARCYRLALQALEMHPAADPAVRCKMLLALGKAQNNAGEAFQALITFREAAASARTIGAVHDLAQAALGFEFVSWAPGFPAVPAAALLQEARQALGDEESVLAARVLSSLGRALYFSGQRDRAATASMEAVAMARRLGDPVALATALYMASAVDFAGAWNPERFRASIEAARTALRQAENASDRVQLLQCWSGVVAGLVWLGDMPGAAAELEGYARWAEQIRQPFFLYFSTCMRAAFMTFQGRFDEGERIATQSLSLGRRLPGVDALGVFSVHMFILQRQRGKLKDFAPLLQHFVDKTPQSSVWRPGLAIMYAELGQYDKARTELEQLAEDNFASVPSDSQWLACIGYLAEVCAAVGDAVRAERLYTLLLPYQKCNITAATVISYGVAGRHLGMLATTMHRWREAEGHFEVAIELNARQGGRPWVAQTQYQYAAMLLARGQNGDRSRAAELLGQALETARALGMAALEERALALLEKTARPQDRHHYPAGLTDREVEVLRLIALGKANREIGERLFVSPNTVANHVRNILAKTGAANRTEAATYALRQGLVEKRPQA